MYIRTELYFNTYLAYFLNIYLSLNYTSIIHIMILRTNRTRIIILIVQRSHTRGLFAEIFYELVINFTKIL